MKVDQIGADWLNSKNVSVLNKSLDGLWQRQRVIAENLANSETVGYKSKQVRFEHALKERIEAKKDVADSPIETVLQPGESLRGDGNNVDTVKENTEMARTQLNYLFSLQSTTDHFTRLKIAITGGR